MSTDLITGSKGGSSQHVTSAQQGAVNAYTIGDGAYILSGCAATMPSANTLHIAAGYLLVQGRFVQVLATDLTIANGSQGTKRHDLACLSYTSSGTPVVEASPLAVVQGTASASPVDPTVAGSILNGDAAAQIPLWRVVVDGITPTVEQIATNINGLPAAHFSTAAQNAGSWTKYADGRCELDMDDYYPGVNVTMGPTGAGYTGGIDHPATYPFTVYGQAVFASMRSSDAGSYQRPVFAESVTDGSTPPKLIVFWVASGDLGHPHFALHVTGRWR